MPKAFDAMAWARQLADDQAGAFNFQNARESSMRSAEEWRQKQADRPGEVARNKAATVEAEEFLTPEAVATRSLGRSVNLSNASFTWKNTEEFQNLELRGKRMEADNKDDQVFVQNKSDIIDDMLEAKFGYSTKMAKAVADQAVALKKGIALGIAQADERVAELQQMKNMANMGATVSLGKGTNKITQDFTYRAIGDFLKAGTNALGYSVFFNVGKRQGLW